MLAAWLAYNRHRTKVGRSFGHAGCQFAFGYADGELLVDCQSLAEGVSGAIACAHMMAVRSNPATGTMQIPPLDDIGGGHHTYRR
jgi:hypothetical protein